MIRNIIIAIALFASINAFPADKSAVLIVDEYSNEKSTYSTFPLFSIFKPIIELFPHFADIGPKIEIGEKYTNIVIKAENYKVEDLSVKIKGHFVILEGSRKTVSEDRDLASEFLYTTSLPKNANTSDVYAKLYSDNYLVVSTPNKGLEKEGIYVDRQVPIIISEETFIKAEKIDETTVSIENTVVTTEAPLSDAVSTTSVPEGTTEAEVLTTSKPTTEAQVVTTSEPVTESQKMEEVTELHTNAQLELETEKEAKTESIEATTQSIEEVTLNTTPRLENEISDLE